MRRLLILGGGTGGTMVAQRMYRALDPETWHIVVVDREPNHYYQPGFVFLPFGIYQRDEVVKPKQSLLPPGITTIFAEIERIEPAKGRVHLGNGSSIDYDELVIATGTQLVPEVTPGLADGGGWRRNIFDFYTLDGALALTAFLEKWPGGRLVVNVADVPIKGPTAPLEFLLLADWFFARREMRHKVEMIYTTPLASVFNQPHAADILKHALDEKGIQVETEFSIRDVSNTKQVIRAYDEREVEYDLLVTIPANRGAAVLSECGLANALNYVLTDEHTLQSKSWENIWVIGDASAVPTSKAASVAHAMLDTLVDNLLDHIHGKPLEARFDGQADIFIESGFGKAYLIEHNYEVEPQSGTFPLPGVGPFTLLRETHLNHLGKLAFRWLYWNVVLKGMKLPMPSHVSMSGTGMQPV